MLDATSFSVNGAQTPKAYYNNMTIGGTVGGPLNIPHVTHWQPNAGNFFLTVQIGRNRNASSQPGLMPTAAQRDGDFSLQPAPVNDPTTGTPFPGNVIPQNRISPQAQSLLSLYPLPNFLASSLLNYQIPINATNNTEVVQTRINRNLNRYNYLNGSFNYEGYRMPKNPNLFNFLDGTNNKGMNRQCILAAYLQPRTYRSFDLQFQPDFTSTTTPFFANKENIAAQAGITGTDQTPNNWGPAGS